MKDKKTSTIILLKQIHVRNNIIIRNCISALHMIFRSNFLKWLAKSRSNKIIQ